MAKQTFTTGQVLTAAQMTSLQQTAMGGGSPVTKTASYVLVAADAGTVIQMNSASSTTITVNTALFAAGDSVQIQNIGAGTCTITAGTATVTTAGSLALTQWEGGSLYFTSTSASIFFDIVQSSGMTNPMTTTGDTIYSSPGSTPVRLGIGSTGNVLTVAGGVPTWAAPSGAGANWSLLNSGGTALTGATTVTVSGISGKDKIMVLIDAASSATIGAYIQLRLNGDTGSNYTTYGTENIASAAYNSADFSSYGLTTDNIVLAKMDSSNHFRSVSGYVLFSGCNSSGVKVFNSNAGAQGGSGQRFYNLGGFYNSSSTISSVSIVSSTGNLDAGTVYIYTSA